MLQKWCILFSSTKKANQKKTITMEFEWPGAPHFSRQKPLVESPKPQALRVNAAVRRFLPSRRWPLRLRRNVRAKSACGAPGCRTDSGVCRRECDVGPVGLPCCAGSLRFAMYCVVDYRCGPTGDEIRFSMLSLICLVWQGRLMELGTASPFKKGWGKRATNSRTGREGKCQPEIGAAAFLGLHVFW